jgi:hypothetical protein
LFSDSSFVDVAVKITKRTQTCATGTCLSRGSMKESSNLILCGEKFVLNIGYWIGYSNREPGIGLAVNVPVDPSRLFLKHRKILLLSSVADLDAF